MQKEFLKKFILPDTYIGISHGHWTNINWYDNKEFDQFQWPDSWSSEDCFFTIAQHNARSKEKSTVVGSNFAWVDLDDESDYTKYNGLITPSFVVRSGYGLHLYFRLTKTVTTVQELEQLNYILAENTKGADKTCRNADRVFRVPNTTNLKLKGAPKPVTLLVNNFDEVYDPYQIISTGTLDPELVDLIRSGDTEDFDGDRSKRDWFLIRALLKHGLTERTIRNIYDRFPCGQKYQTEKDPEHYWTVTFKKITEKSHSKDDPEESPKKKNKSSDHEWIQLSNGIFKGPRRITTFRITPKLILSGELSQSHDSLVCDFVTPTMTIPDVVLPKEAFTSLAKFNTYLPNMGWSFLGNDQDLKQILPFLIEGVELQRVQSHKTIGLHDIGGQYYFLTPNKTLDVSGPTLNLRYVPSRTEVPEFNFTEVADESFAYIGELLPKINAPEAIWPVIGWYFASLVKPWIESQFYRFPILNVTGTKGSGKTTTLKVMQSIFGLKPRIYDGKTTKFVMLSLLGATNCVPVSFSEFRADSVQNLVRFILLSYDGSKDSRGRADQSTVEYPLTAPMTVDGEDLVDDPAAQQRCVIAQLSPNAINAHREFFLKLQQINHTGFIYKYIIWLLTNLQLGKMHTWLEMAKEQFNAIYPKDLPDRVRNNHIVSAFGILLFCEFTGCAVPNFELFNQSLDLIRNRVVADSFVETVVNEITTKRSQYPFYYDKENAVLYFQLNPWHQWWLEKSRRSARSTFELHAIRTQLSEAVYFKKIAVHNSIAMVGIDLALGVQHGLEIPQVINFKELIQV